MRARSTPSTSTLTVPSGQLQQLQDRGDRADAVEVVGLRVVDVGLLLGDEHDPLVGPHGHVERLDGLLPPDEQRDHHVRVHHHVAQRQHRHALDAGWSGVTTVEDVDSDTLEPSLCMEAASGASRSRPRAYVV